MPWPVYIDESLRPASYGPDDWERQLRAAGATGALMRWDGDAAARSAALATHELRVLAVCARLDVRTSLDSARLQPAIDLAAAHRALLALELTSSDAHDRASSPRALPAAAAIVRQALQLATPRGVRVSLFPKKNAWMARSQDAVGLAMRVNHPSLGVAARLTIDGEQSTSPESQLRLVGPRLDSVLIGAEVLTNDDNAQHIRLWRAALARMGYRGAVTVDGAAGGAAVIEVRSLIVRWAH